MRRQGVSFAVYSVKSLCGKMILTPQYSGMKLRLMQKVRLYRAMKYYRIGINNFSGSRNRFVNRSLELKISTAFQNSFSVIFKSRLISVSRRGVQQIRRVAFKSLFVCAAKE